MRRFKEMLPVCRVRHPVEDEVHDLKNAQHGDE